MSQLVVYTAIFGGVDELKDPAVISSECDYVCFTDDPHLRSDIWRFESTHRPDLDPGRRSRHPKLLPHRYFPRHEYSLWLDGSLKLVCDPFHMIDRHLGRQDIALFKHPDRDCIYQEAIACEQLGKDRGVVRSVARRVADLPDVVPTPIGHPFKL